MGVEPPIEKPPHRCPPWFVYQRVPAVWWKSVLIVLLDQLNNAYYLLQIEIRVYLGKSRWTVRDRPQDSKLQGVWGLMFRKKTEKQINC